MLLSVNFFLSVLPSKKKKKKKKKKNSKKKSTKKKRTPNPPTPMTPVLAPVHPRPSDSSRVTFSQSRKCGGHSVSRSAVQRKYSLVSSPRSGRDEFIDGGLGSTRKSVDAAVEELRRTSTGASVVAGTTLCCVCFFLRVNTGKKKEKKKKKKEKTQKRITRTPEFQRGQKYREHRRSRSRRRPCRAVRFSRRGSR
jgi:hypothetical protein